MCMDLFCFFARLKDHKLIQYLHIQLKHVAIKYSIIKTLHCIRFIYHLYTERKSVSVCMWMTLSIVDSFHFYLYDIIAAVILYICIDDLIDFHLNAHSLHILMDSQTNNGTMHVHNKMRFICLFVCCYFFSKMKNEQK